MDVSGLPWKAIATGAAILSGLGALAFASRKSTSAPPPKRVALIGDSYAVGLGPELAKLFPTFQYEGHVGNSTAQWSSHSSPACGQCGDWLTTFKPDVVLVALGVNDGATPNPSSYHTIVRGLHGIGTRVVWIPPPAAVRNADATRQIIASLGVQTTPATKIPLTDGLHPQNYRQWANEIAAELT